MSAPPDEPDGSDAPDGAAGEIFVGGENLADGYEPGPDFGEWVATGDAGAMHDGELFVLGRISDSFQLRGERFFAPAAEARIQGLVAGTMGVAVVPSRVAGVGIGRTHAASGRGRCRRRRGPAAAGVLSYSGVSAGEPRSGLLSRQKTLPSGSNACRHTDPTPVCRSPRRPASACGSR